MKPLATLPQTETFALGESRFSAWPEEPTGAAQQAYRFRKAPYVPWGVEKPYENRYPEKIETLYVRSPYFRRITDDKAEQIHGNGLQFSGTQADLAAAYFSAIGLTDNALEAAAYDLALFNGLAWQVIWNRAHTTPVSVVPQKVANVRVAKDASGYYVSGDWSVVAATGNIRQQKYAGFEPQFIAGFSPDSPSARQLLYATKYAPVADYYPLPDAESVYEELSLGTDVMAFQRKYVQNGMVASAIVYVPFAPEETAPGDELAPADRARMERKRKQIVDDLTGKMKAGQLSIVWFNPYLTDKNGQPTGVPRFERPIEENNDQKFIEIQRESRQAALTGLGVVARELYGIPSAGGFSSQAELLLTAHELTLAKIIAPKQAVLLRALHQLAQAAGITDVQISIDQRTPVSQRITVEMVQAGIFSADEFRAAYGYAPKLSRTQAPAR